MWFSSQHHAPTVFKTSSKVYQSDMAPLSVEQISSDVEKSSAFSLCEARLAASGQFPRAEWSLNIMERHMERGGAPGEDFFLPRVQHQPPEEEDLAFLFRKATSGGVPLLLSFASSWRRHGIFVTAKHSRRNPACRYISL